MPSPVHALAWLCAWASAITQRLLIPACLFTWDLLTAEQPGLPPAPPPTMRSIGRARRFHSPVLEDPLSSLRRVSPAALHPSNLESFTRAQLKELAGVKGNRTKAQLIKLIRRDMDGAECRYVQSTGFLL